MKIRRNEYPEVRNFLLAELRWSERPLTRDDLVERTLTMARGTWGYTWTRTTAARRVREAIAALNDHGEPVVSTGDGYRLARTAEEIDTAARRLEQTGKACLWRAARIRRIPIGQVARQLGLFEEVANG